MFFSQLRELFFYRQYRAIFLGLVQDTKITVRKRFVFSLFLLLFFLNKFIVLEVDATLSSDVGFRILCVLFYQYTTNQDCFVNFPNRFKISRKRLGFIYIKKIKKYTRQYLLSFYWLTLWYYCFFVFFIILLLENNIFMQLTTLLFGEFELIHLINKRRLVIRVNIGRQKFL